MDEVSRVDAVRAGIEFPEYVELMRARVRDPVATERYEAELPVIRSNLDRVFRNPAFALDAAVADYLACEGSNETLRKAFHGLPAFVMDWFRIGQVAIVALRSRIGGVAEPFDMDVKAVDNHLARGGVGERDRERLLARMQMIIAAAGFGRREADLLHEFDNALQSLAAQQDKPVMKPNIWINGSFFLAALVAIFAAVRVLSGQLAPYWLAIVFVGGIVAISAIGVLALRANDQLTDKSFAQCLKLIFGALPLIGRSRRGGR